jgi:hypothetical protein
MLREFMDFLPLISFIGTLAALVFQAGWQASRFKSILEKQALTDLVIAKLQEAIAKQALIEAQIESLIKALEGSEERFKTLQLDLDCKLKGVESQVNQRIGALDATASEGRTRAERNISELKDLVSREISALNVAIARLSTTLDEQRRHDVDERLFALMGGQAPRKASNSGVFQAVPIPSATPGPPRDGG